MMKIENVHFDFFFYKISFLDRFLVATDIMKYEYIIIAISVHHIINARLPLFISGLNIF